MVTITNGWLHQHCSAGTTWTRAQLEILGVAWPPKHGWKHRLMGRVIDEATAQAFIEAKTTYTKRTLKLRRKEAQAILNRSW